MKKKEVSFYRARPLILLVFASKNNVKGGGHY